MRESGSHDESHVVTHWLDEAHHHHEDGSFHEDDSDESVRHLLADCHLSSASLLPGELNWLPSARFAQGPPALPSRLHPAPFLEGPHRPPRISG